MKKIIILLMAVSIMLTSCGKSAGLSNSDKRADNNTPPPETSAFKGNLPQITDGKNDIKQSLINFANDHNKAIGVAVAVIVVVAVSFFAIQLIINKKNDNNPLIKLKLLPELPENFEFKHDLEFFIKILSGETPAYIIHWNIYSAEDLIFIYHLNGCIPAWKISIKGELEQLGYNVSTLK